MLGPDEGNPLQYTGRENDATGLYYYRARYYDPGLKRFISEDPIGVAGGQNIYTYVHGDPVALLDPSGLDATTLVNTSGGRSRLDGPTNGNWGGKCWGGGSYSCGEGGSGDAPPTDSGDACYRVHDLCWDKCRKCHGGTLTPECKKPCDDALVKCLTSLGPDPTKWPSPPKPGTEGDSTTFMKGAIEMFSPPNLDITAP